MRERIHTLVVGGGWSGLATAITLTHQGHPVHLIESAKQLGGRARNVHWQNQTIDNGQHMMIGAYEQMLEMMQLIGISPNEVFHRAPIDITIKDSQFPSLHLSTKSWLPWPLSLAWNLIKSAGPLGFYQVARLQSHIPKLLSDNDITVSEWLLKTKQSERLIRQLWEPLCLATLNTPINQASAHVLAKVLQDSLGKSKSDADLLIPKQALGDLFPLIAANYIEQHGGKVSLQTRAKEIIVQQGQVQGLVTRDDTTIPAENIIVALSPSQSAALLESHITINKPIEYPICTVYLQYPTHITLAEPMSGMTGTLSQWIFDRSEQTPGLMAVVISGPGEHENMQKDELILQVCKEIHQMHPSLPEKADYSLVIREKHATFACTVDNERKRPHSQTDISGLWLAGDYIANNYPATIEGAIRNGKNCAKLLATSLK